MRRIYLFIVLLMSCLVFPPQHIYGQKIKEMLEEKYDFVFEYEDYYKVEKEDYQGACDLQGNEIIAPDKYNHIYKREDYYKVEKGDYEGVCDLQGNEIISCVYKSVIYSDGKFCVKKTSDSKWIETDISLSELSRSSAGYASNTSKTSDKKSNSSSSSSHNGNELIAKGIYTESGIGRSRSTGQYTQDIGSHTLDVEFYKTWIKVNGCCYTFAKKSGNYKIYEMTLSGNTTSYYVDSNYNMFRENTFNSPFGVDWFIYNIVKGNVCLNNQCNTYNGGNYNAGYSNNNSVNYNSGSSNNNRDNKTKHICPVCNGKGRLEKFTYPSLYGMEDYKVKCNECGKYYLRSLGHIHYTCPNCHGKGYTIY